MCPTDEPPGDDARVRALVHDLRTPVTLVAGFADLLARGGEELDPATRAAHVERIREAARELRERLDAER